MDVKTSERGWLAIATTKAGIGLAARPAPATRHGCPWEAAYASETVRPGSLRDARSGRLLRFRSCTAFCATCDVEYGPRKTLRRSTCQTRTMSPTGNTGLTEFHVAPSAKESSASFAITAAARPSVQGSASSVSRSAGSAIAVGYGDFELPEDSSRDQASCSWRSGFSNKEPAC